MDTVDTKTATTADAPAITSRGVGSLEPAPESFAIVASSSMVGTPATNEEKGRLPSFTSYPVIVDLICEN
jgi:hypothetical protein